MDHYITGPAIKALRERRGLTQAQLAEQLCVSDKTVSKWETSRGLPDITLLEPLATALHVSVPELLSGEAITNVNRAANLLRSNSMSARSAAISCTPRAQPPSAAAASPCHRLRPKPPTTPTPPKSKISNTSFMFRSPTR